MTADGAPRVRFAPAPTGFLHVGSARTALFNWLFARHTGGTLVLRIEDTDPERSRAELVDQILRTMEWLGIDWDEGPFRQSERMERYREAVQRLVSSGWAYRCDCRREDVEARAAAAGRKTPGYDGYCRDRNLPPGAGVAVRFRTPDAGTVRFQDVVRGEVSVAASDLEDFVIQRADGTPTFLIANAVDDADMHITHAVRGVDLLDTTPRVLLLLEALGEAHRPAYAHLPLLVDERGQKLSKRRHAVAVEDYRDRGFLPEALRNYLALLGWGPPDGVEIRPLEEIVELFRLEDVTRAPAFFDVRKLEHINGVYIRALSVEEFVTRARPWLGTPEEEAVLRRMGGAVQERVVTLGEVPGMIDFLVLPEPPLDERSWETAVAGNPDAAAVLDAAIAAYEDCPWEAAVLHERLGAVGEALGLKLAKAQAPVRVAVTGRTVGPPLFESLEVLGRERTLARLRAARARLAA